MKKIIQLISHRVFFVVLAFVLQLAALFIMVVRFNEYFVYFYALCLVLSFIEVVAIINHRNNSAYKIAWIITILVLPIFGSIFYFMFSNHLGSSRFNRWLGNLEERMQEVLPPRADLLAALTMQDPSAANQARYIQESGYCPPYENTETQFFPLGELAFEAMLKELEKAQRYIFLEFFIVEDGVMWGSILKVLERKAAEGVDVRIILDDIGCLFTLPPDYFRVLEQKGISCCMFNRLRPVVSLLYNNRDHRKIMVIDGTVAFTGGINIADEYINVKYKYGHWKDCAIMLRGEAAWSFTVIFLLTWEVLSRKKENTADYYPGYEKLPTGSGTLGVVQPYCDNPIDRELTGETVLLNLIYKAKKYIYITTPYLIIGDDLLSALENAAKSGVDVRIMTPAVPDKWYVHMVTRAHYKTLTECGVKIYEYTPGFVHSKNYVVDDEFAVVGTANLDYRSLYLHFECGVWLYRTQSVHAIRDDFLATQRDCNQITLQAISQIPAAQKVLQVVLRMLGPLM